MIFHVSLGSKAHATLVVRTGELLYIAMDQEMHSQTLPLAKGPPAADYITPEWLCPQM